jgi:hypothetical protein
MYTTALSIKPGHYSVQADFGPCTGGTLFTVLPQHNRSVAMVLTKHFPYHDYFNSYVGGSLPFVGFSSAYLLYPNGAKRALVIDGQAYYGEYIHSGDYVLVLELANEGLECRLPIRILLGGTVFNVTAADVRRSLGYEIKPLGGSPSFQPLWPPTNVAPTARP